MVAIKTWEDINSIDDLLTEEEIEIIKETENKTEVRCPHLRKIGDSFYYCGGAVPEETKLVLEPYNRIIVAKQGVIPLQLHCMGEYESCCYYNGSLSFP